jgi:hypothetical protein
MKNVKNFDEFKLNESIETAVFTFYNNSDLEKAKTLINGEAKIVDKDDTNFTLTGEIEDMKGLLGKNGIKVKQVDTIDD